MATKTSQSAARGAERSSCCHTEHKADLVNRLHRIEGQVRGLTEMIQGARSCEDVAMQMAAARTAMDKAFYQLMAGSVMNAACTSRTEAKIRVEVERSARLLERFG